MDTDTARVQRPKASSPILTWEELEERVRHRVWHLGRVYTPLVEIYRAQRDLNIALSRTAVPRGYKMHKVRGILLARQIAASMFSIHESPREIPEMRPLPPPVLAGIISLFPEMVYDVGVYVVRTNWTSIHSPVKKGKRVDFVRDSLRLLARRGHMLRRSKEQSLWIAPHIPPTVVGWEGHWYMPKEVLERLNGVYRHEHTGLLLYRPEEDEELLKILS